MTIQLILFILLIIHGLIHLLGFVHEWKLAVIKQFTGKTLIALKGASGKFFGLVWLGVAAVFCASALMFILKSNFWWIPALSATVVSQLLIILYWKDAKAGTVINFIVLIAGLVGYGNWRLDALVKNEVSEIFARNTGREGITIKSGTYRHLPACVGRWLDNSKITGKENIRTVRLKQKGEMCTKPGGKWMTFEAEQYFTVQRPAFIWKAKVNLAPGVFLTARDKYDKGQGNMLIQALSLYTIANSSGREMDQGTLLRYLAEACWFPSMALSEYISWTEIDSLSARATMTYRATTASGVFTFNTKGDVVSFDALRYGEFDGKFSQERWHIDLKDYKEFEGIRIPFINEVTWKLKTGDFKWLRMELTNVEYNMPELFK
ncbi:MAG: DUF6544 family protein [Bacteroidales bacterium]